MTRSVWKGPFYEEYLLKKAEATRKSGKTNTVIKIWTRRSTILPEFVGLTFGVYNGTDNTTWECEDNMVAFSVITGLTIKSYDLIFIFFSSFFLKIIIIAFQFLLKLLL